MYYQVRYTSVNTGKRMKGIVHTSEKEGLKELKEKTNSPSYKNVVLVSGKKKK